MLSSAKVDKVWITFFDTGGGISYTYDKYMQSIFITKLSKQGTSLGVVIPVEILNAYHWQRGDVLVFGFAGEEQLFLKRLSDKELKEIKPNVIT